MSSAACGGFKGKEGGKFLVLRRDGTIPAWTWFVLGARDPHAPAALRAYADSIGKSAPTTEMCAYASDVRELAERFDHERVHNIREGGKRGDPEAGPHRTDDPLVMALIRGEVTWEEIRSCIWEHECRCAGIGECCRACYTRKKVCLAAKGRA